MSKRKLAKFIADQVDEFLKKGGKVKKLPAGKAKGVDEKWSAEVLKANTSIDYPTIGYRMGKSTKYIQ